MKVIKNMPKFILTLLMFVAFQHASYAQDSAKPQTIQGQVADKDFVFEAQMVMPQRGITRQLTSNYFLQVSRDSLVSDLPYFGRAYSAPINPGEGGIRFTSTSFDYSLKDRKKGGWEVLIKPKDVKDVQQMLLSVFENGRASLQVISNNREAISFEGTIRNRKKVS